LKRKYFFVVLFLITCCLLSCTVISYLAEKPLDVGEYWILLSEFEKMAYHLGVSDGAKETALMWICRLNYYLNEEDKLWSVKNILFTECVEYINFMSNSGDTHIKVVTDLYKDPANTYIYLTDMFDIAYQKIKGEDIESLLQEARKEALQ